MKTIKIFKNKITYFDLILGVIFVVVMISLFLFFYRKNTFVNIRVKITDQDILYAATNPQNWYANRFEVGDAERDQLGRVVTEIKNVETFNVDGDRKAVYLDIRIKAVYDERTKIYSAKGTNLIFGNTIRFYFSKVSTNALITESPTNLSQSNLKITNKTVTAILRGDLIEPEVLKKIKAGDTITDSNGNTLLKVLNINLLPAQKITQNSQGDLLLRYSPFYKDMLITFSVRTIEYKGEIYVFDNMLLRIGRTLPLNFNFESIYPTVIDIK
jgi:hypothetical protein